MHHPLIKSTHSQQRGLATVVDAGGTPTSSNILVVNKTGCVGRTDEPYQPGERTAKELDESRLGQHPLIRYGPQRWYGLGVTGRCDLKLEPQVGKTQTFRAR